MSVQIPEFAGVRVLVVGDVMLDEYWRGEVDRISPEAPVPVVHVGSRSARPGGAGNVAVNLAALGVQVTLFGVTGRDEAAERLRAALTRAGIIARLWALADRPTITKLRVLGPHQQLLRLDAETVGPVEVPELAAAFGAALATADIVVLSDYGKGLLAAPAPLIAAARARGLRVLVDPKGADYERYAGASAITPNRAEFERIVGACEDLPALEAQGQALCRRLGLERLLVTRSEAGMTLLGVDSTRHLPARAREVFDVTGAGDTVIAWLAGALAAGLDWPAAAALANAAAGVAVGHSGAVAVTPAALQAAIAPGEPAGRLGVLAWPALQAEVAAARRRGERIVMTNGCFDLLHPGHVAYLAAARALGDRLLVAVNDDASVRRLKGPSRPINPLADRLQLLAALRSVDWVVPFTEETPAALIEAVGPDVLVKGGDYRPEQIAGHESVLARGGQVRVMPFVPGHSSSEVLARVRGEAPGQD